MHPARLVARATAAQAPLFAAMAALVFVVTGILAGIPRYLEGAEAASARATLAAASPEDAAVRAQIRLADDAAAQSRAMDAVLAPLVSATAATVVRSVQSDPVTAVLADGSKAGILFAAEDSALERIDIVDGAWDGGVALHALAADALGLAVGDALLVGETALSITALWTPRDAADPAWFGDEAVATGQSGTSWGLALLSEPDLAALDVNPFARWTLLPDLERLDTADIAPLGVAAATWETAIRDDSELSAGGVVFAGGLGGTVDTIERGIASVQGVSPIPLVVSGVVGAIAFLQLARLLATMRASETLLLRARGRSSVGAARWTGLETAVVTIPAAALGALAALLVVPGSSPAGPWLIAAAVAATSIAATAAVAAIAARTAHAPQRAAVGGYLAVLALSVIAASVSLWQFRLYGSPVITTATGDVVVEPLAVLAAPLGLLACAVAAVAVLPALFGAAERAASRSTALGPALTARQVSRRPAAFAVPVMLTTLAVASTMIASTYAATWGDLTQRAGELRNGADLRVELATSSTVGGAASITSSPAFTTEGATAAPVLVASTESGQDAVALVALAASDLDVMSSIGGSLDRDSLASAIASEPLGLALAADAAEVAVVATTTVAPVTAGEPLAPAQGATAVAVWVADAQGALARLVLETDGSGIPRAELPRGVAPWTILALDSTVTTGPTAADYRVALAVDGVDAPTGWTVQPAASTAFDDEPQATTTLGYEFTATRSATELLVRLMPEPAPLPAVITTAFADRLGVEPGDEVRLRFAGSGLALEAQVADTVAQLPGSLSPLAALVDLRALNDVVLRTTSSVPRPATVWIATGDPAATEAALALPSGARVTALDSGSGEELQRPVVTALWVGSLGALLLAAAAIAAVSTALVRARRSEVVALRAVGVRDGVQARGRASELALVVLLGVVAGAGAGLGVAHLTVADLARSAVLDAPRTLDAGVVLDLPRLAAALAAFAVAVLALVALTALRVRRQAAASTGREVDA